jgi:hypothetical protein
MRLPQLFSSAEVSSTLKTPRYASNLDETDRIPSLWRARYLERKLLRMLRVRGEGTGKCSLSFTKYEQESREGLDEIWRTFVPGRFLENWSRKRS